MAEKVVVITGASSGIGAAAAELLASRGHAVTLVARRREALEQVAARCHDRAHIVVADVSDRQSVRRVVEEAIAKWGRVDVWINNAGQGITRSPSELTDQDIDEMMRQNVKTALYGMQEILPHFKSKNDGQVINVSSLLGRVPMAVFRSAYCGTKHFLNALTATFRAEVQQIHPGIQFTLVSPGVVRTEFGKHALHGGPDSHTLPGSPSPEEGAVVIAEVIGSRRPDVYTNPVASARIAAYYASVGVDP